MKREKEREEKRRKVIIQAKGRINPDGPPPLLFLEDGSARNRELVTLFFAVLLHCHCSQQPCSSHPWGKAGWLPIFPYCRLPRDTPAHRASHFCHINLRSFERQLAPPSRTNRVFDQTWPISNCSQRREKGSIVEYLKFREKSVSFLILILIVDIDRKKCFRKIVNFCRIVIS